MRMESSAEKRARMVREGIPGHPLRTVKEMAEEFGLSLGELTAQFRDTTVERPQPIRRHNSPTTVHATWYDPVALRRWWKAHNEAKERQP